MIVAELERALLARYPKTDAEPWDHVGDRKSTRLNSSHRL